MWGYLTDDFVDEFLWESEPEVMEVRPRKTGTEDSHSHSPAVVVVKLKQAEAVAGT